MFLSASMCRSSRTACWSTAPGAAWCGTVTLGGCSPCRSTLDTWETSPFTTPHWVSNTHRSKRRRTHIYCTHQCSSELLVRKDSFIIHHSSTKYFVLYKKRHSLDFGPAASVDSDLVWTAEIWPPTLIYCPPRMAVSSSKWSGGMDLWRMFVLVLLTHQPVHHRFSSQHCYRCCRRYGSAAPSSPPTTYLWPGNLSIPHFFTPSSSSAATNIHTHTHRRQTYKFSWWSTRGGELILKWMSRVTGLDYSAGKFIFLSMGKQLKHRRFFQGGLSLMGRVKSQKESLFPHTHTETQRAY